MSSSYGYVVKAYVADWGDGVSASCNVGPIVRYGKCPIVQLW